MARRSFLRRLRLGRDRARFETGPLDVAPDLPDRDAARVAERIAAVLRRHGTETRQVGAGTIADAYVTLDDTGRLRFLRLLAYDFWADPEQIAAATDALRSATDPAERRAAERALRDALVPPAVALLRLFTRLDGGVKLLVDLRADLLRLNDGDQGLAQLDRELHGHLATLFDVGLLSLQRITWDSPASLLEKLIAYEAVHAIDSWADLKNRLDSDRRCEAFFHPAMPSEPLVFVEVALTNGIPSELPPLLDEDAPDLAPEQADTAVFYSISNCQPGLAGVNLGNALIKQVVEVLREDLPQLRRFVTLSPLPGFRAWLTRELERDDITDGERELLPAEPARVLARLADDDWSEDESIRPALMALGARYLTTRDNGRALDPVANFHFSNGASLVGLHWMADPSPAGRARAFGLMCNYLYEPDQISDRTERYATTGDIDVAPSVRDLLA